jgi:hypothetical protein
VTNHDALEPVLHDLTPDQKITILLAAYNKHATALGAIESSQQSLVNLILGIYSVALTLLIALYKDERDLLQSPNAFLGLSSLDWVMIAAALSVAVYAFFMSTGRNKARMSVRQAVTRIDSAFGFFEKGVFLKNETLYPSSFAPYARTSFLQYAHYLLYAPAVAFVAGVLIFSRG